MKKLVIDSNEMTNKDFLDVVLGIANHVETYRYIDGPVFAKDYFMAYEKVIKEIMENIERFRKKAQEISTQEHDHYTELIIEQELSFLKSCSETDVLDMETKAYLDAKSGIRGWEDDLVSVDYRFGSLPCGMSSRVCVMFKYKLSDQIKHYLYGMSSKFDYLTFEQGAFFEDLTFYQDDEIVGEVLSHELSSAIHLSKHQYEVLRMELEHIKTHTDKDPRFSEVMKWQEENIEAFNLDEAVIDFLIKEECSGRMSADEVSEYVRKIGDKIESR